jgi:hypothetical protein
MDPKEQVARALQGQQPPTIMDRLGLSEYLPDWLYDRSTLDRTFPTGDANQSVFTNAANLVGRAPWELPYLAADVINSGEALLSRPVVSQDPEAPAHAMVMAGAAPVAGVAAKAASRNAPGMTSMDYVNAQRMGRAGDSPTVDRMELQRIIGQLRPTQRDSAADPRATSQGARATALRFTDDTPELNVNSFMSPVANGQRGFIPNVIKANPDDVTTGTVLDAVGRSVRDLPNLQRMRGALIERIDAARAEGWADTPAGEALRKQYLELTRNYNEALVRRSEQRPAVGVQSPKSDPATDGSQAAITPPLSEGRSKGTMPSSTSSSQPTSNTTVRAYHGTTRDIKGGRFNDDTFFSSSPDEAATYAGMYGGTGQNGRVYPVDIDTSGFATIDRRRNGRPVEWDDEFDMDVFTAIEEGAPGVVVKGIIDRSGASADQIIPARKGSVRSATTGDVLYANPSTATIMDMIARQLQEREMGEAYRRGDLT